MNNVLKKGWQFSAKVLSSDIASSISEKYIDEVSKAIEKYNTDMVNLNSNQTDAVLSGFVAEAHHANSFNINAIAAGSKDRAYRLGSNAYGSTDIDTNFGSKFSLKYLKNGEKSVVAQAEYSRELGVAKYNGQERLIPYEQMDEGKQTILKRILRNSQSRPEIAESYRETGEHLVDRIDNGKGVSSNPLSKADSLEMAKDIKNVKFNSKDYGISLNDAIKTEYMIREALKSGCTAAAVTVAIKLAPEIFKSIDYLIKTGEIDIDEVKKTGILVLNSATEAFLRGSIASVLFIACEKGLLGNALKGINSTLLGTIVTISLQTIKNSILVAVGKMSPKEMGASFVDSIIISGGYLLGAEIGGIIGQALGLSLPVVGYLIGSMIGCSIAIVYNIAKKKVISYCIDTGFTCFGLVEQNYILPDEVLEELNIDQIAIERKNIAYIEIPIIKYNSINYETIEIISLKRGIIGINKIGYIL